jgi:hypothetical protein
MEIVRKTGYRTVPSLVPLFDTRMDISAPFVSWKDMDRLEFFGVSSVITTGTATVSIDDNATRRDNTVPLMLISARQS